MSIEGTLTPPASTGDAGAAGNGGGEKLGVDNILNGMMGEANSEAAQKGVNEGNLNKEKETQTLDAQVESIKNLTVPEAAKILEDAGIMSAPEVLQMAQEGKDIAAKAKEIVAERAQGKVDKDTDPIYQKIGESLIDLEEKFGMKKSADAAVDKSTNIKTDDASESTATDNNKEGNKSKDDGALNELSKDLKSAQQLVQKKDYLLEQKDSQIETAKETISELSARVNALQSEMDNQELTAAKPKYSDALLRVADANLAKIQEVYESQDPVAYGEAIIDWMKQTGEAIYNKFGQNRNGDLDFKHLEGLIEGQKRVEKVDKIDLSTFTVDQLTKRVDIEERKKEENVQTLNSVIDAFRS